MLGVVSDVEQIEVGLGEKLSAVLQNVFTFIAGFAVAFSVGWRLALVVTAVIPLTMVTGGIFIRVGGG